MIKFDQYTTYTGMKKALKDVYEGDIFLRMDRIEFYFSTEGSDDILALDPTTYTIIGQYGRFNKKEEVDFSKDFSINFQINDDENTIRALFYYYLLNDQFYQSDRDN